MTNILNKLREPFPEEDLEFRVGATNTDKTMGLALAYVQARAIQNRLDEVLGVENWKVAYKEIQGGFLCTLSIRMNNEWISKEDGASITDYESIKGGISSAFKRVASSGFGIGRYLYNARNSWFPIKSQGKGFVFATTPKLELNNKENKKESRPNKLEEESLVIDFGKYKGYTLKEIYKKDISYIKYLKDKCKIIEVIKACEKLLREK
ncbi:Rad52/Rad22 family DNA repair protein [Fusobacterium sp.]|uniref:Rad52/Rad22 family DNA repair protein n=1 Tax=Fusobacterium sp. TaxID=68766 RepID=UPI0026020454|nr:Rad52/Rad22 family DNA repair protein [Fusobacterium sp.]